MCVPQPKDQSPLAPTTPSLAAATNIDLGVPRGAAGLGRLALRFSDSPSSAVAAAKAPAKPASSVVAPPGTVASPSSGSPGGGASGPDAFGSPFSVLQFGQATK